MRITRAAWRLWKRRTALRSSEARAPGALEHWSAYIACVAAERRLAALIARMKKLRKRRGRTRDGNVTLSEMARTQTHLQRALETLDERFAEHVRRTEETLSAILSRLTPRDSKPTPTSRTGDDGKVGSVEATENNGPGNYFLANEDIFSDVETEQSPTTSLGFSRLLPNSG